MLCHCCSLYHHVARCASSRRGRAPLHVSVSVISDQHLQSQYQDSVRVLRRVQHVTKILVGLSLRRDTLGVNLHNVLFTGSFEEGSFPRLGIEQTKKTRRRRERNSWACLRAQGIYESCNKSYLLCKSGQCLPRAPAISSFLLLICSTKNMSVPRFNRLSHADLRHGCV